MTDEGPESEHADESAHADQDERVADRDADVGRTRTVPEDEESTEERIPIDLDRRDETTARSDATADRTAAKESGDVEGEESDDDRYGPEPRSTPIEPGTPSIEHAVFVALGALAMVAVFLRMVASVTV